MKTDPRPSSLGHANGAAHQFGEAAREAQSQTGAAEAARGAAVGLGEGFEQPRQRRGVHADAVVGDADFQQRRQRFALDDAAAAAAMHAPATSDTVAAGKRSGATGATTVAIGGTTGAMTTGTGAAVVGATDPQKADPGAAPRLPQRPARRK